MTPILGYFSLCGLAGWFGRNRHLGFIGWFVISAIVTPLLAVIILLITATRSDSKTQA